MWCLQEQHSEKLEKQEKRESSEQDPATKRSFVMKELIETERDYVRDLGMVVNEYQAAMRDPDFEIPMPQTLKDGKDKIVFGNIETIYEWHREWVPSHSSITPF